MRVGLDSSRGQQRSRSSPQEPNQDTSKLKHTLAQLPAVQGAARIVYSGLAAIGQCPCHRLNLQLHQLDEPELEPSASSTSQNPRPPSILDSKQIRFNFITTKDTGDGGVSIGSEVQCECTSADENPEPQLSSPGGASACARRLSTVTINVDVDGLCSFLEGLQSGKHAKGAIPSKGSSPNYRCLMYSNPPTLDLTSPSPSRISLEAILKRPNKQSLLPRLERLKIAVILSLSLLHFGTYSISWFRERWRSQDIFFFLEPQQQLPVCVGALGPYVVPAFPMATKSTSTNGGTRISPPAQMRGIAQNEQLFSLALVLIEVAFGNTLFEIYEPANILEKRGDEVVEYIKAKMILDFGVLAQEMGPVYAEVVGRCLYCKFGDTGVGKVDLSMQELQELFFRKVVCELKRCLEKFQSP